MGIAAVRLEGINLISPPSAQQLHSSRPESCCDQNISAPCSGSVLLLTPLRDWHMSPDTLLFYLTTNLVFNLIFTGTDGADIANPIYHPTNNSDKHH